MTDSLRLEIVTPEKIAFSGDVEEVTIPGTEGEFGVLKGHAPLLSSVDIGELSFLRNHQRTRYAVTLGYAEVSQSRVTVLVQSAENSDEIDQERAKRARMRAEERLKQPKGDVDFERARIALVRALVRLKVATKG